jgi:hypothetical protein
VAAIAGTGAPAAGGLAGLLGGQPEPAGTAQASAADAGGSAPFAQLLAGAVARTPGVVPIAGDAAHVEDPERSHSDRAANAAPAESPDTDPSASALAAALAAVLGGALPPTSGPAGVALPPGDGRADTRGAAEAGAATTPAATTSAAPAARTRPSRDAEALAPELRVRFGRVVARMRDEFGHEVAVAEAGRTQERQDYLYAQGRTRPGPVVTWTRHSEHTLGRAVDVTIDGGWDDAGAFRLLQRVAREEGLDTLGARDPGHLQLPRDVAGGARGVRVESFGLSRTGGFVGADVPVRPAPSVPPAGSTAGAAVAPVAGVAAVATVATVATVAAVAPVAPVPAPGEAAPPVPPAATHAGPPAPHPVEAHARPPWSAAATPRAVPAPPRVEQRLAEQSLIAQPPTGQPTVAPAATRTPDGTRPDTARTYGEQPPTVDSSRAPAPPTPAAAPAPHPGRPAPDRDAPRQDTPDRDRPRRGASGVTPAAADADRPAAGVPAAAARPATAAAGASTAPAPPLGAVAAQRVADVLAARDAAAPREVSHLTLRLDNADGGEDRIRIDLRRGVTGASGVDARIAVSDAGAAGRLAAHAGELRDALARHGLTADTVQVSGAAALRGPESTAPAAAAAALAGTAESGNAGASGSSSSEQQAPGRDSSRDPSREGAREGVLRDAAGRDRQGDARQQGRRPHDGWLYDELTAPRRPR